MLKKIKNYNYIKKMVSILVIFVMLANVGCTAAISTSEEPARPTIVDTGKTITPTESAVSDVDDKPIESTPTPIDASEDIKIEADEAFLNGDFSLAVELYEELLQSNPQDIYLLEQKALALQELGKTEEAIAIYEEMIVIEPTYRNARAELSTLYFTSQDYDEAEKQANAVIDIASSEDLRSQRNPLPIAYNMKGAAVQYRDGDFSEAATNYAKAIEESPNYAAAMRNLGWAQYQLSDFEEAEITMNALLDIEEDADEYSIQEHTVYQAEAHKIIGYVRHNEEDVDIALDHYWEAIELNSSISGVYGYIGFILYVQQEYDEALEALEKEISLNQDNEFAHLRLGQIYQIQENLKAANEEFNTVLTLNPENSTALSSRALVARNLGNYEDALDDYNNLLDQFPEHAFSYYGRGISNWNLGNWEDAITDFDSALNLDLAEQHHPYALQLKAIAYFNLADYELASADFQRLLDIQPENSIALYLGGRAQIELQQFEDAVDTLTRYLELNPDNKYGYLYRGIAHRGIAYQSLEELDVAIEDVRTLEDNSMWIIHGRLTIDDFDEALIIDSDFAEPLYFAAGLYEDNTELEYAAAAYSLFLERYTKDDDLRQIAQERYDALTASTQPQQTDSNNGAAAAFWLGVIALGVGLSALDAGGSGGNTYNNSGDLSNCPWGPGNGPGGCMSDSDAGGLQLQDIQRNP